MHCTLHLLALCLACARPWPEGGCFGTLDRRAQGTCAHFPSAQSVPNLESVQTKMKKIISLLVLQCFHVEQHLAKPTVQSLCLAAHRNQLTMTHERCSRRKILFLGGATPIQDPTGDFIRMTSLPQAVDNQVFVAFLCRRTTPRPPVMNVHINPHTRIVVVADSVILRDFWHHTWYHTWQTGIIQKLEHPCETIKLELRTQATSRSFARIREIKVSTTLGLSDESNDRAVLYSYAFADQCHFLVTFPHRPLWNEQFSFSRFPK